MKFTVNTDVLQHEHLTIGDFLVLLIGYYGINYKECLDKMLANKLINTNVFNPNEIVLSNNTKDLVTSILTGKEITSDKSKLKKDYAKLYNKYKVKYNGQELLYFISQKLYSKGYTASDIKEELKEEKLKKA